MRSRWKLLFRKKKVGLSYISGIPNGLDFFTEPEPMEYECEIARVIWYE